MIRTDQLIRDLEFVFSCFPVESLLHLRANRHRLTRGAYSLPGGLACFFYLLTEVLPSAERIASKRTLTLYFGGDPESPQYQPARWLVRLWDRQICERMCQRYGESPELTEELLMSVLEDVIAQREAEQEEPMTIVCRIAVRPPRAAQARRSYLPTGTA
jgi:hypothetical protein